MCGISGFIGKEFEEYRTRECLEKIHASLSHRGPNGSAITSKDGVLPIAFGHHRLAIQDLSSDSDQPMKSPSGSLLVFNGEIYNKEALRQEIGSSWDFVSSGDTEVLLAVLELYGANGISKVEGIFAFAFANPDSTEILLGRDRLGVKPLYWSRSQGQIWFASESKALGEALGKSLDDHAFHEWAVFQFPVTARTFFRDVVSVPAGHIVSIRVSAIKEKKYWNLSDHLPSDVFRSDFENLGEKLEQILVESIKDQMIADVPVASFNSGGMDSSTVTSIAAKFGLSEAFVGSYDVHGFSEVPYAKMVALNADIPLTEVKIDARSFFEALPRVISSLDFPVAGPGSVGQYLVSKEASKNYRVLLSGSGGDELFLGYTRDRFPLIASAILDSTRGHAPKVEIWNALTGDLRSLAGYGPMHSIFAMSGGYNHPLDGFIASIDRRAATSNFFDLDSNTVSEVKNELISRISPNGSSTLEEVHSAILQYEMGFFLSSLLHVEDRISMASGLEVRVPLLSTSVIEFLLPLSLEMRLGGSRPKDLLRAASKKFLPSEILARGDKMGFPVPLREWGSSPSGAKPIRELLSSITENTRPYIRTELIDSAYRSGGLGSRGLWALMSLETWFQNTNICL